MTSALHVVLAVAGSFVVWRAAIRVAQLAPDDAAAAALPLAVFIATTFGSFGALVAGGALARVGVPVLAGRSVWSPARALALDAATLGGAAWWLFVLTLGPWTRELGGISLVCIAVARLAPAALAVATLRAPSWLAFAVALGGYGALAAWLPAASLPLGDEVHYVIGAEQLRRGSLDATVDAEIFRSLVGFSPGPNDVSEHVADTPLGPRPVQGYALQMLLVPGWAIAGLLGAHLTMAVVGAWASWQMFLVLRDLHRGARPNASGPAAPVLPGGVAGWTWLLASFLAPMSPLATHIYPNMLGAAIIATAFRAGFTAPIPRPALAAGVLALTLFLTPRDGIALLVLLPFLLWSGASRAAGSIWSLLRRPDRHVAVAAGAVALVAVAMNALLYGLPAPYAGYAFGTAQAQAMTQEPSITLRFWVGLPAMLFDRNVGLAGTAPWVFIGLLGLVPLLRFERDRRRADASARPVLLPAALTVGVTVLALSLFRHWEGGYAPPNRYLVDVLPLWTPFVAVGLMLASGLLRIEHHGRLVEVLPRAPVVRALVAVVVFLCALMSLVLNAVPTTALNAALDHKVRDAMHFVLGLDLLAWLPTFRITDPSLYVGAYLRLIPAVAIVAGLVLDGAAVASRLHAPASPAPLRPVARAEPVPGAAGVAPGRADLARFVIANAVGIVLVVATVLFRPLAGAGPAPVPASLMGKWLPLALALATAGSVFVAAAVPNERRAVLRRHFAVYLPALVLMLVAYAGGPSVLNAQFGAVYLAIAAIFAVNALLSLWRGLDRITDRSAALHLATVALVAFLILLPYHRAVMPTASDEPHYLLIVQSLIYDGDLDLRNDYEGDRYSAFYPARLEHMHGIVVGNAAYSIRDLGLPVLSVVPFAIAGRAGVLALMCLVGAALAAQLYLLLRDLRFDPRVAFLAVATTVLAHPIFTYTTQVYPELLTALLFVATVRVLRAGTRATHLELALASAAIALLPVLSTRAWLIAFGLGLVVAYAAIRPLWDARRWLAGSGRVAAAALPFVAIIAALSFANWLMFGVFLPSAGYYLIREQQQVLAYSPQIGATGVLFDRVFGLIPRSPVFLLGFLGVAALVRRARAGHGTQLAALALGGGLSFLYIANIAYWHAEGSPPPRYLVGATPLLVVAVAGGWEVVRDAARAYLRWLAWASVVASAAVMYLYAVLPITRYDYLVFIGGTDSTGSLFQYLDQRIGLDPGIWFPSLLRPDLTSIVLAMAWLGLAGWLGWLGWSRRPTS